MGAGGSPRKPSAFFQGITDQARQIQPLAKQGAPRPPREPCWPPGQRQVPFRPPHRCLFLQLKSWETPQKSAELRASWGAPGTTNSLCSLGRLAGSSQSGVQLAGPRYPAMACNLLFPSSSPLIPRYEQVHAGTCTPHKN